MPEVVNVDVAIVVVICCIADDALDVHVSFKNVGRHSFSSSSSEALVREEMFKDPWIVGKQLQLLQSQWRHVFPTALDNYLAVKNPTFMTLALEVVMLS